MLFICVYIPPGIKGEEMRGIHDALLIKMDTFLAAEPDCDVMAVRDFNHFDIQNLRTGIYLDDIVTKPTRASSILVRILVSRRLTEVYAESKVSYDCPIGNSDHLMISCSDLLLSAWVIHTMLQMCLIYGSPT